MITKYEFAMKAKRRLDVVFLFICLLILDVAVFWGLGSLITWNFDVSEWHWFIRMLLGIPCVILAILLLFLSIFYLRAVNKIKEKFN